MVLKQSLINSTILTIIVIVLVFQVYATLIPEAQSAGDTLNASNRCDAVGCFFGDGVNGTANTCFNNNSDEQLGCDNAATSIPLSGLFGGSSLTFVIIMASLLILLVIQLLRGNRK